jgi:hypothetical protein
MSLPVDITGELTGNPQVAMIESRAPSLHAAFSPDSLPEHSAVGGCGSLWISSQQGRLLHTGDTGCMNMACVLGESHIAAPSAYVLPAFLSLPEFDRG